ncbi:MAG: tyrosine-type recombinase/integrase [Chloroflexi bacterium]|nr:tyrosine-type recombinase/integrase [Chloroflexota bacterium]
MATSRRPGGADLPLARATTDFRFALAAGGRRATTVGWYADILDAFVQFATGVLGRGPRLADLTVDLGRRYAVSLSEPAKSGGRTRRRGQPLSRATVRGHLKALKVFAGWLRREGYLSRDALASLEVPRDDRRLFPIFSDGQLDALLRVAEGDSLRARRWTAVLWVLLDTGLRLSELTGLALERVDLEVGAARVVGKGGTERLVPIGSAALFALRRYLERRGGPARGAVFLDDDGRPLSPTAVYKGIRSLGTRAGITGVRCSPHTFRHTFATRYLLLGGDLLTLARLLGHSPHSLEVTQRYVTLLDADLRAAHRRFSPGDHLARLGGVRPARPPRLRPERRPARRSPADRPARPARAGA